MGQPATAPSSSAGSQRSSSAVLIRGFGRRVQPCPGFAITVGARATRADSEGLSNTTALRVQSAYHGDDAPAHQDRGTAPVLLLDPRGRQGPGAGREVHARDGHSRRRAGEARVPRRAEGVQAGQLAEGRQIARGPPRIGARALRVRRARQGRRHLRGHPEVRRRQPHARGVCTEPARHLPGSAVGQAGRPAARAGREGSPHGASARAAGRGTALQPRLPVAADESRRRRYRDAARVPSNWRRDRSARSRSGSSSRIRGGHASRSRPASRS